ncbi:hypothetical protein LB505_009483 [Fusarium chuoi]|nr:hypothetical protein LB505_009483 [Fusarium chuoi]
MLSLSRVNLTWVSEICFPNNFKIPKDTRPFDMFRDASIHSLIPTTLLLLCLDAGYVLAASETSGPDRCPDYVANHAPLLTSSTQYRNSMSNRLVDLHPLISRISGSSIAMVAKTLRSQPKKILSLTLNGFWVKHRMILAG